MIEVRVRDMESDDSERLGDFNAADLPQLLAAFVEYGYQGVGNEFTGQFEPSSGGRAVFVILYDGSDSR